MITKIGNIQNKIMIAVCALIFIALGVMGFYMISIFVLSDLDF